MSLLAWNQAQWNAANRNVASCAAGVVVGALVTVYFMSSSGIDGLVKFVAGLTALVTALTPFLFAFKAAMAASPSSQVQSVIKNLSAPEITQAANAVADPGSRNKLIDAVAEMPEVDKINARRDVANATASPKVVATT